MFDIITVGSATRDVFMEDDSFVVVKSDDFPEGKAECFPVGSKIDIDKIFFSTGGGGANAAVTFARQGFKTSCVAVIGDDLEGRNVVHELERENIDTSMVQRSADGFTSYSVILVHTSGARTILNYKGVGRKFDVGKLAFDKLKAKCVYFGSTGGHWEIMEKIIDYIKGGDTKLAINTTASMFSDGPDKLLKLLPHFDIFTTNREEGAMLTGIDAKDWDGIAGKIYGITHNVVSVSGGTDGSLVIGKDGTKYRAGIPDAKSVERTGAGDAFASGLVAEYLRSGDARKAIQFATANASSVVQYFGAKTGILRAGEDNPLPPVDIKIIE